MRIVVIGGTGLVGSKLVTKLSADGHEVVAASPSSGVNTLTGEGLAEALQGASVVVDLSNSPSLEVWTDPPRHFAVGASRWWLPLASLRQDFRRPHGLQAIPLRRQIIQEIRTWARSQ
jgi:nucleoside-diphosphate-sugar epimerase